MKDFTLFDTPFAKARSIPGLVSPALAFLTKNLSLVLLRDNQLEELARIRLLSSTPVCRMFQDLASVGKLDNFCFFNLTNFKGDTPEILALDDVVVDGRMLPAATTPAQLQKCWINLTSIVGKKDSYNGNITITDTTALASTVVRSAITSVFHDNDTWIHPKLAAMVIENYALTIGHVLSQLYMLTREESLLVQTLFAAYYAQCLSSSDTPRDLPPILLRCQFLGSGADIFNRMTLIRDLRDMGGNDILTPAKICDLLTHVGPPRLKKLVPQQLYRIISSSSIDSQTMMIAIDFPPYWIYQMLRVASGYKNPTMSTVVKVYNLKNKLEQFADEFHRTNVCVEQLNRGRRR